ncbi:DNA binding domain, excisionase family [Clostridiales bacterium 1_7_47FAA]|uniref:Helix-turn-helix domain-containing protein n=1 Tax=Enterocloster hominis (ex Hitch et al. 2024) TaxID=1917870 RepID=A0ABV1DDU1_9FIRM|nr:DNA binding domain, excisionase family [Clostridiales bacterium 1_7_47FAA]
MKNIYVYKPHDLMDILGISRSSVYKLLQSGALKSKKIGRLYRIPSAYVEEYLGLGYNDDGSFAELPEKGR